MHDLFWTVKDTVKPTVKTVLCKRQTVCADLKQELAVRHQKQGSDTSGEPGIIITLCSNRCFENLL